MRRGRASAEARMGAHPAPEKPSQSVGPPLPRPRRRRLRPRTDAPLREPPPPHERHATLARIAADAHAIDAAARRSGASPSPRRPRGAATDRGRCCRHRRLGSGPHSLVRRRASAPPPRCSSAATHPQGHPRGVTMPTAVPLPRRPPPPRHLAVARRALREARRRSPRRAAPRRHRAARRSHVEPPRPRPARAPPRLPRRRDGVSPPPPLPPPPSAPLPPAGPAARRARLLPQPSPGARRPAAPSVPARPPPSRRPRSAERRPLSADESSSSSSRASAQSRPSRRGRAAISSACRARRRSVFGPPRSPLGGQRTDAPRDPSSRRRGRAALRPIDAARTVRVALRAASHEPRARRAITRRRRLPKCREEVSENRNF